MGERTWGREVGAELEWKGGEKEGCKKREMGKVWGRERDVRMGERTVGKGGKCRGGEKEGCKKRRDGKRE